MSAKFAHLHTHSHYSLLTALPKIPDLVGAAQRCNMPALALTDNGNLYGAIEFYKACNKQGIKPIIGIDAYVAARTRADKEAGIDNRRSRLVLLAKNEQGYKNLIQLVTRSNIEGFYYKPRMDHELLAQYSAGLIAILPSFSSEVSNALKIRDRDRAKELVDWHRGVFGESDVYLEITHHPEIDGHKALMQEIVKLSTQTKTPLVAAHDVYYIFPEDRIARETVLKIQTGTDFTEGTITGRTEDFSFIDQEKALEYFKDTPEAVLNTMRIAEKCDLKLEFGKWVFPNVDVKSGRSHADELRHLTLEGLRNRNITQTKEITDRYDLELKIINGKGYAPYFLVVADLVAYAHKNNIITTTRGSAAGSLVSYLTGITNVNPIEYSLPFERFLNPQRPSPPDIDMDIADNKRDEMIQYVRDTYGEDKVAQIGTFGTMLARGVVRDIARALGYPYNLGDRIARLIPLGSQGFPMTIEKAMEMEQELKALYKQDKDVRKVIDLAQKIEGNARHISIHAAGVVISPTPLSDYVPLQYDPKGGKIVTQYDMHSVEAAGLLKFDFLGIKNLSILADSVERVKVRHDVDIDIENIPLDDEKVYSMLTTGETMGLFQLGGSGMTRYLKELKPTNINDINAMIALYRPGPMEVIPEYIRRKNNPDLITYPDPRMEKFLQESYGLIVYQDDLLLSAIELAGYSWVEADKFRKAVGKKIPAEMAAQKEKFIDGIIDNGQTKVFAERLWKLFEPFQSYGFNKAHAASYGKVAYQTSYMKANYPIVYMAALFTADAGNVDKIAETIIECDRMGISVLPPDINESEGNFTIVTNSKNTEAIRFGLYSIKNFGEGIADAIIEERENNGKFSSLAAVLERIQDRNLNRKSLEALIKCGAMDQFGERGVMLFNIDALLAYNKECTQTAKNQDSLFSNLHSSLNTNTLTLESAPQALQSIKLAWEKELLGLYVSGHPLDNYRELLKKRSINIKRILDEFKEGMTVIPAGIVEELKMVTTKNGDKMAFAKLADLTGTIEVVLFPRVLSEYKEVVQLESCLAFKGRVSARNGEKSIIAEAIKKLGTIQQLST